ncbi:ZMAT5-like protein [Mya arenaria]|uniref:ZMAT5-like protein n=1 Tax=Mya arenaria TaxID=6604 RepID=A0ABY7E3X7_MYAAR|nr:zinc finger matrin-type protein 5-like [Mya arenaria]WAR03655.1 ZMAT5-like protein [Mya arenaria]
MGKRYYCDFCDRSFADTGVNRKNHFKGVQHQRLKKQHYDSFRDPATILSDDSGKMPCKRFHAGQCDYGDSCKFSHMTQERRQQLQSMVAHQQAEKKRKLHEQLAEPSLDEWLEKRQKRLRKEQTPGAQEVSDVTYELPPFLNRPNLPPSLLPPASEELKNKPQCEWG